MLSLSLDFFSLKVVSVSSVLVILSDSLLTLSSSAKVIKCDFSFFFLDERHTVNVEISQVRKRAFLNRDFLHA